MANETATDVITGDGSGVLSEPLLRPEQVASLLGVRRSSVYEYVRAGRLPHVKVGRHLRFLRSDLEGWVLRQRRPGL
ncbi:MAG: helix-turn-helix domain-containing protein [Solirubrobacterales bacterium]